METTVIDRLYNDNRELLDYLKKNGEISFQSNVDDNFRKTLLLSAASYFEAVLKESLMDFFQEKTNYAELILRFIQNKAIERQYHTYFSWKTNNANSFFGLFGDGFKYFMQKEVRTDKQLENAIHAFLKLGNFRNELVHQNFAIFPLENTAEEIYELYKQALLFVKMFPKKLQEYYEKNSAK